MLDSKFHFSPTFDILSIKHVVFAKATFFPSWFHRPAHQLKHSDITLIEIKNVKTNCGKPGGRQTVVKSSLVAILINAFTNDNE